VLFAHAKDRAANEAGVRALLTPDATRWQYTHGVPTDRADLLSPATWVLDQAGLDRPGNAEVQLQLFWDYQFNLDSYPTFQEYFRTSRPPALITWGEHDEIFGADGARAFTRDLPDAEIHLLDAGHFALETHGPEIAALIRDFLGRVLSPTGG
jgi:pimeloyl-ACP methyl ester carboxylesterase